MGLIRNKLSGIYTALTFLILLYSVSTITQAWYPFSMNRLLTFGMIGCIVLIFIGNMDNSDVLVLCGLGVCLISSSVASKNLRQNVNDYIYFFTTVLFIKIATKKMTQECLIQAFQKNRVFLRVTVYGCIGLVFLSLLFDSSYKSIWGESARYFCGFAGNAHTVASSICLVMALFTFMVMKKPFHIGIVILLFLLMCIVFMTGARTFVVTSVLIVVIYTYSHLNRILPNRIGKMIVYIAGGIAAMAIFFLSPMADKILSTDMSKADNVAIDIINRFSNGRISIWSCLLDAFKQESAIHKIFGIGFDQVYGITEASIGSALWAHNDFLHLLVGTGVVGLATYLLVLLRLFAKIAADNGIVFALIMTVYVLFPAIMNGFWFSYFHLFLSFIILVLCGASQKEQQEGAQV